ncbi:hypothetical protein QL285_011929 [Trifolium repens]|nr:hypothetical protein QL285_011929 [Trifolium repens]
MFVFQEFKTRGLRNYIVFDSIVLLAHKTQLGRKDNDYYLTVVQGAGLDLSPSHNEQSGYLLAESGLAIGRIWSMVCGGLQAMARSRP